MDANLLYNMCRFSACRDFFGDMKDIPYAMIKGEALSLAAYHKAGLRQYTDIDILTPKDCLSSIERCLSQRGFVPADRVRQNRINLLLNSHQIPPWKKPISLNGEAHADVLLDINFDIFWGEYEGERIDIKKFLEDAEEVSIFGISVKCLPPIKALIQLALHHYKDMNSIYLLAVKKVIHTKMFEEIYYLIMNHLDSISPEGLEELCEQCHMKAYMYYVLYFTNLVYHNDILDGFVTKLKDSQGEELIPYYGLCRTERKAWKIDFETRLREGCLLPYMIEDLSVEDMRKIEINRKVFQQGVM